MTRTLTGFRHMMRAAMNPPRLLAALALPASVLALAACGSSDTKSTSSTPAAAATTTTAADACRKDGLKTYASGKLTIATDKPAFPPYFVDDDPTNGKGFESATAYAIAKQLGFAPAEVSWKVVPFNSSYAPGAKKFDFDINQISINAKRKKAVDFSSPYFNAPQAVVVPKGSTLTGVKTLADLKDSQFGVQVGTTSLDAVTGTVKPSKQPKVFDDSNAVVQALKNKQVDAVVVDLPTAFYLTSAEIQGAKIIGQFKAPGGDDWGALLPKGSSLTPCVTKAVEDIRTSGELQRIYDRWLGAAAGAPELR
jgi:polar amino acid transport system substrate-binding protein